MWIVSIERLSTFRSSFSFKYYIMLYLRFMSELKIFVSGALLLKQMYLNLKTIKSIKNKFKCEILNNSIPEIFFFRY